jgi:hypothetical protein
MLSAILDHGHYINKKIRHFFMIQIHDLRTLDPRLNIIWSLAKDLDLLEC